MKSTELRIGNYVKSIGIEYVVWKIDALGNVQGVEGGTAFNLDKTAEPIPLTEEWLVKFGFELTAYGYKRKGWAICLIKQENGYLVSSYSRNITLGVKYVHTLQNLYFALTGEELTLKNEDK